MYQRAVRGRSRWAGAGAPRHDDVRLRWRRERGDRHGEQAAHTIQGPCPLSHDAWRADALQPGRDPAGASSWTGRYQVLDPGQVPRRERAEAHDQPNASADPAEV